MDVSILIINYNTKGLTADCINSVFEKTLGIEFEVILVDNASTDGSKELFQKDQRIKYIYNQENVGFGRANNIGLKIAKGRNIFFLNSDTYLLNNAIKELSSYLDNNSDVGACGGNLFYEDLTPNISFVMQFPSLFGELNSLFHNLPNKMLGKTASTFNSSDKEIDVAYISGADLMVKKSVLDKVGGFDPDFFMYFEETELCYRIKEKSMRLVSVPSSKIVHLTGRSLNETRRKKPSKFYLQSKRIYIYKLNRNILYKTIYRLVVEMNILIHKLCRKW